MNRWKRGQWLMLGGVLIVGSIALLFGARRLFLGGETQTPPMETESEQAAQATIATTTGTDPDACISNGSPPCSTTTEPPSWR